MKAALLLTLSFLFASLTNLPLAFSKDDAEPVFDVSGNPLQLGGKYYIMPAIVGPPGGGVKLGKTKNSNCPVTVLQDYSEIVNGLPVEFHTPGLNFGIILTDVTPLYIFMPKPNCAENSQWSLFYDREIRKVYVGIGGPEDHRCQQMLNGKFRIQKYGLRNNPYSYKLVFCPDDSSTCSDIGTYDNHEGGKRLVLTQDSPLIVAFVNAYNRDATIKSVV